MTVEEFLESKGVYSLDTKKRTEEVRQWMQEYAWIKCAEQRAICAKEHLLEVSRKGNMSTSRIINAPEPNFD